MGSYAHVAALVAAAGVLLALAVYAFAFYFSHSPRAPRASELESISIAAVEPLPHILASDATLALSVVVPCFNEESRLPDLLNAAVPYLETHFPGDWEILVVDDGSSDSTVDVALAHARQDNTAAIRCCKFVQNRGKGGAVTFGMNHARGRHILFADADNASDFTAVSDLVAAAQEPRSVAIGSRAHLVNTDAVIKRSALRNALMRAFHLLVYSFGVRTVRDTQCGFKLFTRAAAQAVFPYMHTEGWIFDVEALLIAQRKGIPIREIAISWHEVTGSKIDIARDSIKMAVDLVAMRFAYLFGIYDDSTVTHGSAELDTASSSADAEPREHARTSGRDTEPDTRTRRRV